MRSLSEQLRQSARYHVDTAHGDFLSEMARAVAELEQRQLDHNVRDFHLKLGYPAPESVVMPFGAEADQLLRFRRSLLLEEVGELTESMGKRSLSDIAAETVDVVYVALGTLVSLGVPFRPFWDDIHRANMEKIPNPSGGKALKGPTWNPPRPSKVLHRIRTSGEVRS